MLTILVFGLIIFSKACKSIAPLSSIGMTFNTMPFRGCWSCQGTILEWCSTVETMTSSPSCMKASLKLEAIRFNPSVVPRVKTISFTLFALMNLRTVSRAPSWSSVACWLSQCTPRCTLALTFKYSSRILSSTQSGFCVVAALSR